MKYSLKDVKTETDAKSRIKRSGQAQLVYVKRQKPPHEGEPMGTSVTAIFFDNRVSYSSLLSDSTGVGPLMKTILMKTTPLFKTAPSQSFPVTFPCERTFPREYSSWTTVFE